MTPHPKPRKRHKASRKEWELIRRGKFDGQECRVCGSSDNGQLHHLVPRSQRGDDHPDNLVRLCLLCHAMVEAHDETTCLRLGLKLTGPERSYVINRKSAYWLAARYKLAYTAGAWEEAA